jgi:acetyltransferase-like isoleucine patch superfamily enzyme
MISCRGTRWIVGSGTYLDIAYHAWSSALPDEQVTRVEIAQYADYAFNMGIFSQINPDRDLVFIAFNEKFGNFKRVELMQATLERGFQLDSFISPKAMLSAGVCIGINSFIADGVIVGAHTKIGYNTVVLSGTSIGFEVQIKPSCWIESGVHLADGVTIGTHSILRTGTQIAPDVKLGRYCEVAIPGRYDGNIPSKTVFDPRYDAPIYVYG